MNVQSETVTRPKEDVANQPPRLSFINRGNTSSIIIAVFVLVFAVGVPMLSPYYVAAAGKMVAYAIVAMGASIIIQHANLPSIGHGAFFGIAAYSVGLFMLRGSLPVIPALLLTLVVTAVAALLIGVVALRTRAAYFMMITLAVGQLLTSIASSLTEITGGDNGLSGIPLAEIGPFELVDPTHFFAVGMIILIAVMIGMAIFLYSPFGYALRSLRHDDRRARSLGVKPLRVRLIAFVISAIVTGLGGSLYTLHVGFADPSLLSANASGAIFLMVVLASRFGIFGPIIGAFVIEFISLIIGGYTTYSQLILGIVALLAALFWMESENKTTSSRRAPMFRKRERVKHVKQ